MPDENAGSRPTAARPVAVTAVCLLGALALALTVSRMASRWSVFQTMPLARQWGTALWLVVLAATLLAYWLMRRWGLWLLAFAAVARFAVGAIGALPLRPADLALPLIVLAVGLVYRRRLR